MLDDQYRKNVLGIEAQESRNLNERNALRGLHTTNYLSSGGFQQPQDPSIELGGRTRNVPSFGLTPRSASAAQIAGANALEPELRARLQSGGSFTPDFSYTPTPVSQYAKPGWSENIGSYGAVVPGVLSTILGQMQAEDDDNGPGNKIISLLKGLFA